MFHFPSSFASSKLAIKFNDYFVNGTIATFYVRITYDGFLNCIVAGCEMGLSIA